VGCFLSKKMGSVIAAKIGIIYLIQYTFFGETPQKQRVSFLCLQNHAPYYWSYCLILPLQIQGLNPGELH